MKKIRLAHLFGPILIALLLIATPLIFLYSNSYAQSQSKNKKDTSHLNIVATTGMIGDVLHNIVQDKATITTLMKPGVDPHSHEMTAKDMDKLNEADIIFYNGLHLESRMQHGLKSISRINPVYAVSEGLCKTDILRDPQGGVDPHIWGDVRLFKKTVVYISTKLQEKDPTNATLYKKNTKAYLKKLETLHQSILQATRKKLLNKYLITEHDSFHYFCNAYKMKRASLLGISTLQKPGLGDVIRLRNLIIEQNIKTIFLDATPGDKKIIQALVESCQTKGHQVQTRMLYSDTLGEKGTPAGTYIGMVQENLQQIVKELTENDTTH